MIRAALTPFADAQQVAVAWLDDHFKTYGDMSPNSYMTKISITFRFL